MFEARIDFADLSAPVGSTGGGVIFGGSWIRPYAHRLLWHAVWESEARLVVASWERFSDEADDFAFEARLSDDEVQARIDDIRGRLLDYGLIILDRRDGTVRYRSSAAMTAPVYLLHSLHGVTIDWDYTRLLAGRPIAIDLARALIPVALLPAFSAETMVHGLWRSAPGATLIADEESVAIVKPEPIEFRGPQTVAPGVDVEQILFETMQALLAARPLERERTGIELSGGMDSALARLATAAVLGDGVMSVGAQFDGPVGDAQRARRRFLCEKGGFDDLEIPAGRYAPFSPPSLRRRQLGVWPEDENFPEVFEAIFTMLQAAGIDALVTGLGGDELYFAYEGEEDRQAPPAAPSPYLTAAGHALARTAVTNYPRGWLQDSCWLGAAAQTQTQRALRYGVWPIYPYHAPALAKFVGHLPWEYRRDRILLRRTLTRVTGDAMFEHDYEKESFRPVAFRGARENRAWLIDLLRRSAWLDPHFVDVERAMADLARDPEDLPLRDFNSLSMLLRVCSFFQPGEVPVTVVAPDAAPMVPAE